MFVVQTAVVAYLISMITTQKLPSNFMAMIFVSCYCLDLIYHVRVWASDHAPLQIYIEKTHLPMPPHYQSFFI